LRNIAIQLRLKLAGYNNALKADTKLEQDLASSNIDGRSGFDRLVLAPLRALAGADEPKSVLLIVVDSLDESLHVGRDERDRRDTVGGVLADVVKNNSLPSWLRIVASLRPERAAAVPLCDMRMEQLEALVEANHADVLELVRARLPAIVGATAPTDVLDADALGERARTLAQCANGNFMWATAALEQLNRGNISLDAIGSLPPGLERLYAASRQIKSLDPSEPPQ